MPPKLILFKFIFTDSPCGSWITLTHSPVLQSQSLTVSSIEEEIICFIDWLYVFDIIDLENINLVSVAYTASWPNNIFVNDKYIFLSDFEDGVFIFDVDDISSVKTEEYTSIIRDFNLYQNYPNPFNPFTTIKYSVPNTSRISLIVYDILGREIQTLVNEEKLPGNYSIQFDGTYLSSGVYFYTLTVGNFVESKKMTLMK